jgi:hypothetical protein
MLTYVNPAVACGSLVQEWLFYLTIARGDEYEALGLAVNAVNIRPRQLRRFVRDQPTWIYTELNAVSWLKGVWPLDERDTSPTLSEPTEKNAGGEAAKASSRSQTV